MGGTSKKCEDCEGGIPLIRGNGKCSQCYGSGVNVRLNTPDGQCENCKGTGGCPTCGGAGFVRKATLPDMREKGGWVRMALSGAFILIVLGIEYCRYAQQKYVPLATAAAGIFHQRFAVGDDDQIFLDSDSAWSDRIDGETERKAFTRIRRKMGSCAYGKPLSWATNSNSKGTTVTLVFQPQCANGPLREIFIWRIVGTKALLASYSATSILLLMD